MFSNYFFWWSKLEECFSKMVQDISKPPISDDSQALVQQRSQHMGLERLGPGGRRLVLVSRRWHKRGTVWSAKILMMLEMLSSILKCFEAVIVNVLKDEFITQHWHHSSGRLLETVTATEASGQIRSLSLYWWPVSSSTFKNVMSQKNTQKHQATISDLSSEIDLIWALILRWKNSLGMGWTGANCLLLRLPLGGSHTLLLAPWSRHGVLDFGHPNLPIRSSARAGQSTKHGKTVFFSGY